MKKIINSLAVIILAVALMLIAGLSNRVYVYKEKNDKLKRDYQVILIKQNSNYEKELAFLHGIYSDYQKRLQEATSTESIEEINLVSKSDITDTNDLILNLASVINEQEPVEDEKDISKCVIPGSEYAIIKKYYKEVCIIKDYLSVNYSDDVLQFMQMYKEEADKIGKQYTDAVPGIDYDRNISENLDMYEDVLVKYKYSYQVNEKVREYLKEIKEKYSSKISSAGMDRLDNMLDSCNYNMNLWKMRK